MFHQDTVYAFEHPKHPSYPNGYWSHRSTLDFRDEQHAKEWAKLCGFTYRGRFSHLVPENAPGSAYWCETQGDNH